jgi:hypothetical protein
MRAAKRRRPTFRVLAFSWLDHNISHNPPIVSSVPVARVP